MLSDRTKVVRGVLAFLAGCAVLGLFMGLRGAMPGNVDPDYDAGPLSAPSGVVVEATPAPESALVAVNEVALNEEAKSEDEEASAEVKPAAPAATPAPAAPVEAPKEEAPPADPVGELIEAPAPPPPGDLY